MTQLTLRPVLPPFDRSDGVGELVQVGIERVEEVQERVPADTSMAVLDLRDVCRAERDAVCELLLRKPCPVTQCTQSVTKGHVVTGGGMGWLAEQDRTETPEGRGRAAAKATVIKRFLASVTPPETAGHADVETTDGDA